MQKPTKRIASNNAVVCEPFRRPVNRIAFETSRSADTLSARRAAQDRSTHTIQLCADHPLSYPHFLGLSKAQNLCSRQRRIIFLAAIAARDEDVACRDLQIRSDGAGSRH